jgi:hypothetical protein
VTCVGLRSRACSRVHVIGIEAERRFDFNDVVMRAVRADQHAMGVAGQTVHQVRSQLCVRRRGRGHFVFHVGGRFRGRSRGRGRAFDAFDAEEEADSAHIADGEGEESLQRSQTIEKDASDRQRVLLQLLLYQHIDHRQTGSAAHGEQNPT